MTFVEIFIGRDQQRKRHPLPTYEEIEAIFEPAPIFDFSVTPEKHENMMFSQIDLLVRNLIPEHFDKLKAFWRGALNLGLGFIQGTGDATTGAAGAALGAPGSILQGVGNLFKGF